MRIFKGLENIHAVIDRHENEWRKEQGEQVEDISESYSVEESVRRRLTKSVAEGSGKFSADRFLGGSSKKESGEAASNVEVVSVIKEKDGKKHSWLYNEVVKAINDAVGDDRRTKVVAVFIPVIQNSKEFEDLPVDERVTLAPVNIEAEEAQEIQNEEPADFSLEDDTEDIILIGKVEEEEEKEEKEETPAEISEEINEPEQDSAEDSNENLEAEAAQEDSMPEETHDFDLIPASEEHPDEELAEAFSAMEEKIGGISETETEEPDETTPEESFHAEEETQPDEAENFETPDGFENPEETQTLQELEPTPVDEADEINEASDLMSEPEDAETENENAEADEFETETESESLNETEELEQENGIPLAEAMSFEEFPVIKEDSEELEGYDESATPVQEFLEDITQDTDETDGTENKEQNLDPDPIEDFDDDEVFEEPIETLNELSDEEKYENEDEDMLRL